MRLLFVRHNEDAIAVGKVTLGTKKKETFLFSRFFLITLQTMKQLAIILLLLAATAIQAQTTDGWHGVEITASVENEQVNRYLTEVDYDGFVSRNHDYPSYSKVRRYAKTATDY